MKLTDLEWFLSVSRSLNMTVAAGELDESQGGISGRMKALGEYLGDAVVERRSNGGVALTDAGKRVIPYAREMLSLAAEMKAQCAAPPRARLGVNESVALSWLGEWLVELRRQQPQLAFELKVGTTAELGALVLQGALDFAIGTRAFGGKRLKELKIAELDMVFVGSKKRHRREHYSLQEVAAEGLITFQIGATPTDDLYALLERNGLERSRVDAISSVAIMLKLVESGGGVATLPRMLVEHHPDLTILRCAADLKKLPLWLSWQSKFVGSDIPPALKSLRAFLNVESAPKRPTAAKHPKKRVS